MSVRIEVAVVRPDGSREVIPATLSWVGSRMQTIQFDRDVPVQAGDYLDYPSVWVGNNGASAA